MRLSKVIIPSPVQIMIRANEAVARIVDDQEVIRPCEFNKWGHLHGELRDWVRATWYAPRLGTVIETLAEDLLKSHQVWLDGQIVFPSQQEDRDTCIYGSIGLRIDKHRRVLQMSGKGLEVGAFGRGCSILDGWQRLVVVLNLW
jgi:hypothetical protein